MKNLRSSGFLVSQISSHPAVSEVLEVVRKNHDKGLTDDELMRIACALVFSSQNPPKPKKDKIAKDLVKLQKLHEELVSTAFLMGVFDGIYIANLNLLRPDEKYLEDYLINNEPEKKTDALRNSEMIDVSIDMYTKINDKRPTYSQEYPTPFSDYLNSLSEILNFKIRDKRVMQKLADFKKKK